MKLSASWRNTKVASTVGFLILIVLIWLVGPLLGLESIAGRLGLILGVMLLWVVSLLVGRILSERAGALLEKVLRRQTDDAVVGATAEQRRDVAHLRQCLLNAIETLKSSQLGKNGGKAALYELPWYMIIGHPAAGKSSAILYSGLDFPFGDKQAIQGVGGTRNCDWFFTTEGVLLDTAGRYSTQLEDRPEWLEFLKLLKKYRAKAPANGIVVAVSFPELVQHNSEQFAVYARQIRERINEIDDAFGIKVPIYLIFTKIDLLGGFSQFFEDISDEERHAVWGATFSHDQGSEFDAVRVVGQQFDLLHRGLVQVGFDKLANNPGNVSRPALFAFPIEFNGMREAICKFVHLLFQEDPYHSKPLLRGFYFTSALQEGSPQQAAGKRVSNVFDLSRIGKSPVASPTSNSYFLRTLFREVIFPDKHLITRQLRPKGNQFRLAGIIAGLSCLALIVGGMTLSFIGNQKLLASAQEELLTARKLVESGDLGNRLKALQVLQLRIEQLYRYRREGHPITLALGLYQGDEVEMALRKEYFAGLQEIMLKPVKASLESTLTGLGSALHGKASAMPAPTAPVAEEPARPVPKPAGGGRLPVIPIAFHGTSASLGQAQLTRPVFRPGELPEFMALRTAVLPAGTGAAESVSEEKRSSVRKADSLSVVTGGNRVEDGYNALKTYLMLQQKEHMEAAHLSDQIPKYWRQWLEANRGNGSRDEINRLAERVVAFYVSQIGESDLPLIENRVEVVGQSREVLRGAFRQLSAIERVYNELKARANTQFAPMTVGRILNNQDLDLIVGSSTLPGVFTREAWDKYFNAAISDASKGTIKGDDWVLETSSLENLGKDGNLDRNRKALETLYKAEYTREWKKFLQGIVVQEFGSLDKTAQALGKFSDDKNSALKQILSRAAYETSWDNPSAINKTIESAKNSVLERTERLVLGTSASVPVVPNPQLGEVGAKFALISVLTQPGEAGRMPLAAYLDILAKLKEKVAQMATNSEPGSMARQLMQATLNSSGSEFTQALALIDGSLLGNASAETKEIVRPLLVRPLIQAYATLIPYVEQDINREWQAEVMPSWRQLSGKYPFADAGNEAAMSDIAKFLKPGEGTLPRFVEKNLGGLVSVRGNQLVPKTWANLGISFSSVFLSGVAGLTSAGNTILHEGENTRFELQPVPTPGMSEIAIEIDGQILRYRNGPQPWTGFAWPNLPASTTPGARIQTVSVSGVSTTIANFDGRLGLMRLLGKAKIDELNGNSAVLEWRLKPGNSLARGSSSVDSSGESVRFNFRLVGGPNPISLFTLRRLSLPEKITHRGS